MLRRRYERQSVGQLASCSLAFVVGAVPIAVTLRLAWRDWTLFALFGVAMYLMGGMRWFPWGGPIRKAFSVGVFVGIALPTIEWVSKLKH